MDLIWGLDKSGRDYVLLLHTFPVMRQYVLYQHLSITRIYRFMYINQTSSCCVNTNTALTWLLKRLKMTLTHVPRVCVNCGAEAFLHPDVVVGSVNWRKPVIGNSHRRRAAGDTAPGIMNKPGFMHVCAPFYVVHKAFVSLALSRTSTNVTRRHKFSRGLSWL